MQIVRIQKVESFFENGEVCMGVTSWLHGGGR